MLSLSRRNPKGRVAISSYFGEKGYTFNGTSQHLGEILVYEFKGHSGHFLGSKFINVDNVIVHKHNKYMAIHVYKWLVKTFLFIHQ